MATLQMPTGRSVDATAAEKKAPVASHASYDTPGLLDDELLDLYAAILIVVPVALFLKSLWF